MVVKVNHVYCDLYLGKSGVFFFSGGIRTLCLPNERGFLFLGRRSFPMPTEQAGFSFIREAFKPYAYRTSRVFFFSGGIRSLCLPNKRSFPFIGRHSNPMSAEQAGISFYSGGIQPLCLPNKPEFLFLGRHSNPMPAKRLTPNPNKYSLYNTFERLQQDLRPTLDIFSDHRSS